MNIRYKIIEQKSLTPSQTADSKGASRTLTILAKENPTKMAITTALTTRRPRMRA